MKHLFVLASILCLTGCSTGKIFLPFAEVNRSDACPAFKKIGCAPRIGHTVLRLNQAPFILRDRRDVPSEGNVDYFEMLGSVFDRSDKTAAYPRMCSLSGAPSPFAHGSDDTLSLVDSNTEYELKGSSFISASAGTDLSSYVNNRLGLSQSKQDAVTLAIEAGFARARTADIKASFSMFSVRLDTNTFNELFFGQSPRLAGCRQLLASNSNYRFVDAISVFRIRKQTIINKSVSNIQAAIGVALGEIEGGELSRAEVESVEKIIEDKAIEAMSGSSSGTGAQFSFERNIFESLDSSSPDYSIVVSLSFVDRAAFLRQHPSNSVW